MNNLQKKDIVMTINQQINRVGNTVKIANKCNIPPSVINRMCNNDWRFIGDVVWMKVADKLGHVFSNWQIAETTNYRMMQKLLNDAKREYLFIPVSYRAGSGKTEGLKAWMKTNNRESNYMIKCREWNARDFIEHLIQVLGPEVPKGYASIDTLGQIVINRFVALKKHSPTLILDQANSLKPSALKFLIHLYNELEDEMSVIIVGTENLEKKIKRGVRYNKDGYDEIDSRFGRNYIHLIGSTLNDIAKVCNANGISDKSLHKSIFNECEPVVKVVGKQQIKVVEDMRRVKRIIKREKIRINYEQTHLQP